MSPWASLAEARIQESIENGEFTDLAGRGQPLDMDAYFAAPSSLRAGFGFLKQAGVVPPEVEAMRMIASVRERLAQAVDAGERSALRRELQTYETELAMGLERMKRTLKADATF